jgi:SAM-dependent methyltransferase
VRQQGRFRATGFVGTAIRRVLRLVALERPARRLYYRLQDLFATGRDIFIDNPQVQRRGVPDGLPLPPARLVNLVQGSYNLQTFYSKGLLAAQSVRAILKANGAELAASPRVLDFGCGCGRVIRHWHSLHGVELHGCDYNPRLIDFCRRALPFARFEVNELRAPLVYADDTFDVVYALSVFTHLDEAAEDFWLRELTRIVKPGGHLFITVQGTRRLHAMTPEQRARFERGERITENAGGAGSNDCYAYHPEQFVRRHFGGHLTVVDFVPGGQADNRQDVCLLRKPAS